MKLIVCDDQKNELEDLREIMMEYSQAHPELSLNVECFSKPLDMLMEADIIGPPDIALLDICTPGVLGEDIAREIRVRTKENTDIIFLTASSEFAAEAFALRISSYVTKSHTKKSLIQALEKINEKRAKQIFIPIQCGNNIYRINLEQITYAEVKNHKLEIHLNSGGCLKARTSLTAFKSLLKGAYGFYKIGASYLVNLRYVVSVLQSTVEMENGDIIPVPRRLRSELKKQYFEFYAKDILEKQSISRRIYSD